MIQVPLANIPSFRHFTKKGAINQLLMNKWRLFSHSQPVTALDFSFRTDFRIDSGKTLSIYQRFCIFYQEQLKEK